MRALRNGLPSAISTLKQLSRHTTGPVQRALTLENTHRAASFGGSVRWSLPKLAQASSYSLERGEKMGGPALGLSRCFSSKASKPLGMDGAFVGRTNTPEDSVLMNVNGVFATVRRPDGRIFEDVIQAGAACSNGLGNGCPTTPEGNPVADSPFGRVQAAISSALSGSDPLFVHTSVAAHPWTIDLCHKLRELAPKSIGKGTVSVQMTGTDAVFAAVDAARLHGAVTGRGPYLLVGESSYHGSGDIAFGDNPKANSRMGSRQAEQVLYPCYNPLFEKGQGESEADYIARLEKRFRDVIESTGTKNISGILIEPVSGSSRVAQPPSGEYMEMILRVCRENDILVVADEVMCGLGRIGGSTLWASEKFNINPDIVVIGKSLGGGSLPIAATLIGEKVAKTIRSAGEHYLHSHTYSGFALGSKAATQALEEFSAIAQSGHVDKVARHFNDTLRKSLVSTANIHVHGEGLMVGGYLLDSVESPTRYDSDVERLAIPILKRECLKNGVDVYAVNTSFGPGFMCVPPLTITHDEVTLLGERLAAALDRTIEELNAVQNKKASENN